MYDDHDWNQLHQDAKALKEEIEQKETATMQRDERPGETFEQFMARERAELEISNRRYNARAEQLEKSREKLRSSQSDTDDGGRDHV